MFKGKLLVIGMATAMALTSGAALADGDAGKGEKVFKKCKVCHSTKKGEHKIGPSLAGVFGRKAGSVSDFTKYKAFKGGADFSWDEDNLDKWVANQKAFLKDKGIKKKTGMKVKIKKEKDRENLIAYLKTL